MRRIAILRPEPGATETLAKTHKRGLDAFTIPLFRIERIAFDLPALEAFDGLLLTSANAARMIGELADRLRSLPLFVVGKATAEAAREIGLQAARTGNGGIESLLETLPAELRLLHLCAEDRREVPASRQVTAIPVYRSAAIAEPGGVERLVGSVVLVHSPRAGQRLAELVRERSRTAVAAISPAAAEACGEGWERIAASEAPNDEALLSLAERLCNKSADA